MDLYEKTNDERDLIQLKDTFEEFKVGDVNINMSKKDKRTYTKNYFTEKIQNNIILKYHYKERERRKEIVQKYRITEMKQVIWGFKLKTSNEEDYGEDDE